MQKKCFKPSDLFPVHPACCGSSRIEAERKPLIEVFGSRPKRFDLLRHGAEMVGIGEKSFVLEVGCAQGAGALFLAESFGCRVLGVDCNGDYIAVAQEVLRKREYANASFMIGRAESLPLENGQVDSIVSEASFSLLADKPRAVAEYWRVLRPGGFVIINDFTIRSIPDEDMRKKMDFIPCFAGVQSVHMYRDIFEQAGFSTQVVSDEYKEIISTTLWIGKAYGSKPADLARVFVELLNDGSGKGVCNASESDCRDFFHQVRLGYAQLIFVKDKSWQADEGM
jgi:ubiquinone/menaquinone biosynthesis C-methylase UbiE